MSLADNLIYMITPTTATVPSGSVLPLTTIARRTGRVLKSGNDSVLLGLPGYYKVTVTVTFTVPTAGNAEIKIQKNSVDVPGIVSGVTVTTATTAINSLFLSGVVRVLPFEGMAILTILNSGVDIDSSNISFDVEYLG